MCVGGGGLRINELGYELDWYVLIVARVEDLEILLLEEAGRTGGSGRKRQAPASPRRRCEGSYSGNGSDSRDDDSDDDRGYANRKCTTLQFLLKKRLDPLEREDERSSREEGSDVYGREDDCDDDSIGSDLYKDEDDRGKLAQMTVLEREMILSEN
ncbi:hypothetical protein AgCh_020345 [Apium graveolens]